ncbi:MAG: response regulator transcription factor [Luteolibacter sp.]
MSARILIIEDDESLRRGLLDHLGSQGWEVLAAKDGEEGYKLGLEWKCDLILLDIMLPGINGFEICQALRREKITTPILMLTAKGQTEDVVRGLELGADDYLVKPFALQELIARLRVLLRRQDDGVKCFTFGEAWELDLVARKLLQSDKEVILTPKEFDLLSTFLHNAGRALSRDQLISRVWGNGFLVTQRSVDRCVKTLRSKLGKTTALALKSIHGIGYRWDGSVQSD